MKDAPRLGSKIRTLRRREKLTQVQLAQKLGISASYLNLIEHDRRPMSAQLLIQLAQIFQLDLGAFAVDEEQGLTSDLLEIFGDPIFDPYELTSHDVRELAASNPTIARAVLALYQAFRSSRESANSLLTHVSDETLTEI